MKRRDVVRTGLALAGAAAMPPLSAKAATASRPRPGTPGWPTAADWASLNQAVGGRLSPVTLPNLDTPDAKKLLSNPFYIGDQPGLTQSSGWLDAWRSAPSAYVVAAESAADVAAAVRFARAHNLRLVVKGRGHSYLRRLQRAGLPADLDPADGRRHRPRRLHAAGLQRRAPVPAVSVGAGAMWLHAYQAVTAGAGRYVQGGGCTTVGVAGLVQGGGFGSFSKGFGTRRRQPAGSRDRHRRRQGAHRQRRPRSRTCSGR